MPIIVGDPRHTRGLWLSDGYGVERLASKEAGIAEADDHTLRFGELCYRAVSAAEPQGRPVEACELVEVRLGLVAPEDRVALRRDGLASMRQVRLARLGRQAQEQGALLTIEDLAYLTCSSPATVKRDLSWCRSHDKPVPTRGLIHDIGSDVAHHVKVVRLHLIGATLREIERRTACPADAAQRYVRDFRDVALLHRSGLSAADIQASIRRSFALIEAYMELADWAGDTLAGGPRGRPSGSSEPIYDDPSEE